MEEVEPEGRKGTPEIGGKFRIGQILEREIAEGSVVFREQCQVMAVRAVGANGSIAVVTSAARAAKTLQLLTEAQVDWSENASGLNWHPIKTFITDESMQALAESLFHTASKLDELEGSFERLAEKHDQLVKYAKELYDTVLALQSRVDGLTSPQVPAPEPPKPEQPKAPTKSGK